MDHFNAIAVGRTVVLFLMPASATRPTGSIVLSIEQARQLAECLEASAVAAEFSPLSGAEAVAEATGTGPDQLRIAGVL